MDAGDQAPARPLRLGFAGTPQFAAQILDALLQAGRRPVVVYTQPDRPTGRGRRLLASPVKALANAHHLALAQPPTLRGTDQTRALAEHDLDALVVAAYGLILPPAILAVPRYGCINVHASLLPRWRGAAPVERAIMAGDRETGVCIMAMDRGLDTGDVYLCRRTPIGPDTDGPTLEAELADLGAQALLDCLARLPDLQRQPQEERGVTYADKLTRADARIDWQRSALEIHRQVRALTGRMPAFTFIGSTRLTVLEAAPEAAAVATPGTIDSATAAGIRIGCGKGVLNIRRLQLSVGKGKPLRAAEALNGYRDLLQPGTRLRHSAAEVAP